MNQKPAFPYATHLDITFPATASRYAWGEVVGVTSHDQPVVQLVDGRRVAFSVLTGLPEAEK